jgi:hypothetical protein
MVRNTGLCYVPGSLFVISMLAGNVDLPSCPQVQFESSLVSKKILSICKQVWFSSNLDAQHVANMLSFCGKR